MSDCGGGYRHGRKEGRPGAHTTASYARGWGETPPSAMHEGYVCGCACSSCTAAPRSFPSSFCPSSHAQSSNPAVRRLSCSTPRQRHGCATIRRDTRALLALRTIPRGRSSCPPLSASTSPCDHKATAGLLTDESSLASFIGAECGSSAIRASKRRRKPIYEFGFL